MRHQNSVLHQILQVVPWGRFEALVDRHGADDRVRRLSTKSQLVALLHAQLSGAQSLREIEATLKSHKTRLYHAGVTAPARSTLADANAKRPAALFAELFAEVLSCAHTGLRRQAREAIHLIDATSISLNALSLDWADYAAHGAALKIHVDYRPGADIPTAFAITPARVNDITQAKTMAIERTRPTSSISDTTIFPGFPRSTPQAAASSRASRATRARACSASGAWRPAMRCVPTGTSASTRG